MSGPLSPYLGILRRPSGTALALAESSVGGRRACLFICLLGVLMPFPGLYEAAEDSFRVDWQRLPLLLIAGPAVALLCWWLMAWLYRNFSRMLGGTASVRDIRIGMGWGLFPAVCLFAAGTLLSLFWIHFAYEPAAQGLEPKASYMALLGPLGLLFFAALLYAYGVLHLALSGVARLSLMKAFFALVITLAVSVFPLTFVLQLVMGVN